MIVADTKLEKTYWEKGLRNVFGVDEAGRGPLAGPVVAGCVLLTPNSEIIEGIRDSKKLSKKKREQLYELITSNYKYGVGVVSAAKIDSMGIQEAVKRAMLDSVSQIDVNPDHILIDGMGVLDLSGYSFSKITRGDLFHYSIAAASIIAKVHRDRIMLEYSEKYPNYGFDRHAGYGTKAHIESIKKFGVCGIHRKSFEPIKSKLKG